MSRARSVPLIVFGLGHVGSAFLSQLMRMRSSLAERYDVDLQPIALADRRASFFDPDGLSADGLESAINIKASGHSFAGQPNALDGLANIDLIRYVADHGIEGAIVVDASTAFGMEALLAFALGQGYGVVLANKRTLAGPWISAQVFFRHPLVRFEATVGAGLPVVSTLRYLVDTGDAVQRIEGSLSGTLGYLCTCLEEGQAFSAAVADAREMGYTESDPRDDLSGMDVARKAIILGRLAGWPLELSDLEIEPVYHAEMSTLSIAEFMAELPTLDAEFAAYMGGVGGVLRYMAELSSEGGSLSLRMVGERLAVQLQGTLNQVSFWTGRYDKRPLCIIGPGAGREMAAAALLEDCLQLAQGMSCVRASQV